MVFIAAPDAYTNLAELYCISQPLILTPIYFRSLSSLLHIAAPDPYADLPESLSSLLHIAASDADTDSSESVCSHLRIAVPDV